MRKSLTIGALVFLLGRHFVPDASEELEAMLLLFGAVLLWAAFIARRRT